MQRRIWTAALSAAVPLVIGANPVASQIDYRNLDDGRPIRVTDAQPVERYAFELSLPLAFRRGDGGSSQAIRPHLDFGAGRNLMLGLGADLQRGEPDEGVVEASVFWNPLRETRSLPAFAFTVEALTDFDVAALEVGAIGTRSFGRTRIHANASVGVGSKLLASDWSAGVAVDYTLLRTSTLVAFELTTDRTAAAGTTWNVAGGLRRQLTPTLVGFAGVNQSLEGGGTELSFGLSHAFAVAGMFPRPRRAR